MSTSEQIVLVASFDARPETRVELLARLHELARLTTRETGCLQYELHENVADPNRFAFVETWADAAALSSHDRSDHVQAMIRDVPRLATGPVVIDRLRKLT